MIKVWLQSYTPELGRSIPLFQGSVFSGTHCIYQNYTTCTITLDLKVCFIHFNKEVAKIDDMIGSIK